MKIFNTPHALLIKRSLDVLTRLNKNVAENISNLNVPGYRRKPTRFSDQLMQAQGVARLRNEAPRHIPGPLPEIDLGSDSQDPVEITHEMTDLALNQVRYDFSARIMRRYFDGLRQSITGRNG